MSCTQRIVSRFVNAGGVESMMSHLNEQHADLSYADKGDPGFWLRTIDGAITNSEVVLRTQAKAYPINIIRDFSGVSSEVRVVRICFSPTHYPKDAQ